MGKYASCVPLSLQCRLEVEEMKRLLAPYNVEEEVIEEIKNMIVNPYYLLNDECSAGRVMEKYIKDMSMQDFIRGMEEEKMRYPFDPDGEELEDEEE